jgi:hypothetical protein
MGCTYVKEFDFGTKKAEGGAVKYAKGGMVQGGMLADKSKLGIKLAKGGKVPRVEAMDKREMAMTPTMRREAAMTSRKVEAPARKMVPVASREPMLAMKKGGKASMC